MLLVGTFFFQASINYMADNISDFENVARIMRKNLPSAKTFGCSGGGIIGNGVEVEQRPAPHLGRHEHGNPVVMFLIGSASARERVSDTVCPVDPMAQLNAAHVLAFHHTFTDGAEARAVIM